MFSTWDEFISQVNVGGLAWKDLIGHSNGSQSNDLAKAGNIGEYLDSTLASGSATALSTGTAANVTKLVLTSGDWDVSGTIEFTGGGTTTVAYTAASLSTTSATNDTSPGRRALITYNNMAVLSTQPDVVIGPSRFSVAAKTTTTVYLVAQAGFAVSTCSAFGIIRARRMR